MKTLYVHIPFCERKCFYCSFVVSIGQEKRIDAYLDCLCREAKPYEREDVQSVYIGGGTPTLLSYSRLKKLLDMIHENFRIASGAEFTVESNPEGLDFARLELLRKKGVNRISVGVQSLNDKYLKYLGRSHDATTAYASFERIGAVGFDSVNADLMFAFPGQTMNELKEDVEAVVRLKSGHLSLYTLTVEEHSRFYARDIQLEDGRYQAEQYLMVCDLLCQAGFEQYEISNFAKPLNFSRHNLNYWQGGEYIGLGVGAHSFVDGQRFWNTSKFTDYISLIQKGGSPREGFEALTTFDQMKDVVLFGLRMNRGVSFEQVEKRFGCFMDKDRVETIDRFVADGFLVYENGCLKASRKGRLVLDALCAQLV